MPREAQRCQTRMNHGSRILTMHYPVAIRILSSQPRELALEYIEDYVVSFQDTFRKSDLESSPEARVPTYQLQHDPGLNL